MRRLAFHIDMLIVRAEVNMASRAPDIKTLAPIRIPEWAHAALLELAHQQWVPVSVLMRTLILDYVRKNGYLPENYHRDE
jgi:hypothetical protein